jgi:anti-sigma factor RsiW
MTSCPEFSDHLHGYIDGELEPAKQLAFEAHLSDCADCSAEYDRVRQVVDVVRGARPLYPAPAALSPKLQTLVQRSQDHGRRRRTFRLTAMIGAFAATILLFAILPMRLSQRFTSFAAETHLRYAQGALPLGVSSQDSTIVSAWLQAHLPFHLSLPNFPANAGVTKSYSLVGARSMRFDGHDIAYLAYTMGEHPISLLVSSSADVIPSGGAAYTSGNLLFHFSSEKGLKLITWRDRGLSYALVSDVQVSGAESCVVCHGSDQERRKFENLLKLESTPR